MSNDPVRIAGRMVKLRHHWLTYHDLYHFEVSRLDRIEIANEKVSGIHGFNSYTFHEKPIELEYDGALDEARVAVHEWLTRTSLYNTWKLIRWCTWLIPQGINPLTLIIRHFKSLQAYEASNQSKVDTYFQLCVIEEGNLDSRDKKISRPSWVFDRRPEVILLLCSARTTLNLETIEEIRTIVKEPLNWDLLLDLVERHEVSSLVYQSLNAVCSEAVPADILSSLRRTATAYALRNIALTQQLFKALSLLESHQILALPYKGAVLAANLYKGLGLRQFGDLDILVHEKDFDRAIALLIEQEGYAVDERGWRYLSDAREAAYVNSSGELPLNNGIAMIDLHHKLLPQHFLSTQATFEELWERRQLIAVQGQTVPSLGQEDLLLYLCMHGAKECWKRLKWVCDVAECVRSYPQMDWDVVMAQAAHLGATQILLTGLCLANSLLDVELPELIAHTIRSNRKVRAIAQQAGEQILDFSGKVDRLPILQDFLFQLKTLEKSQDKVQHWRWHLGRIAEPNTNDQTFLPLPHFLYFLYPLIRPIRLLLK